MASRTRYIVPAVAVILAAIIPAGLAVAASSTGVSAEQVTANISDSAIAALIGAAATYLVTRLTTAKKTDLDILRTAVEVMQKERDDMRTNYSRVLNELEQERTKRRALADRMETFENLCFDKDRELESLRCEVEMLRTELSSRDQRITELTAEVEELRALVERLGGQAPRRKKTGQ